MERVKELEAQNAWSKKGKKYKTSYFSALKSLYGDLNGKDSQVEGSDTNGSRGSDPASCLADKAGDKI